MEREVLVDGNELDRLAADITKVKRMVEGNAASIGTMLDGIESTAKRVDSLWKNMETDWKEEELDKELDSLFKRITELRNFTAVPPVAEGLQAIVEGYDSIQKQGYRVVGEETSGAGVTTVTVEPEEDPNSIVIAADDGIDPEEKPGVVT